MTTDSLEPQPPQSEEEISESEEMAQVCSYPGCEYDAVMKDDGREPRCEIHESR